MEFQSLPEKDLDRIGMRERRKLCAARLLEEEGRHAVSKISRAVSMKIVIKEMQHSGDEKEAEDSQSEERN
ncbi:hypothetical protein E2C01_085216 [Portunus trituberculatus]|uniref:Uncharacterized protein n=1 Tax=Portunus trituberculatus TaxID=210409 RepID=A0A5B7J0D1_PORTR|nr:hypothetical protein [Portunus trituberculatus]